MIKPWNAFWRTLPVLACVWSLVVLPAGVPSTAAQGLSNLQRRELVAVLDMDAIGASEEQAIAMTDRFREELLKTGKYTLVDRSQIESILNEQALQQTGCTNQECAVQVGQILGVRQIVTGKVTRIDETQWLLTAQVTDVETAETLRAESIQFRGGYFDLLATGIGLLAAKVAQIQPRAELLAALKALEDAPPERAKPGEEGGMPWWAWALIGVAAVAAVAASGGDSGGGDGTCSSGAGCGTVRVSW